PPMADFADRKGRMQMGGGARHGFEPKTLPADHDRAAFAKELVEVIADHAKARPFDRLMIAAPPKMLGLLRAALPGDLGRRLVYDTPLDLIDERPEDLAPHFAAAVRL
ncbi:MAG: host attachment protein, partial [Paracoccaceae bacterium]|nr:host attachment protein [Paracoccaceae bacterium]